MRHTRTPIAGATPWARSGTGARAIALAALTLIITSCTTHYEWTTYPEPTHLESLDSADWMADLAYLQRELHDRNPHLEHDPEVGARFDAALADAMAAVENDPSPATAITGVATALAAIGEGHTSINAGVERLFPFAGQWFADGYHITVADAAYREIVGGRVVGVVAPNGETLAMDEVGRRLNGVISVDHSNGYRHAHSQALQNPYLATGLGLAGERGLTLEVELDAGATRDITLLPADGRSIEAVRVERSGEPPLAASSSERNWWIRTGENGEVLYVSYDECNLAGFAFFRQVLREIRDDTTRRVIVDLRENGGGASFAGTWFSRRVRGVAKLREPNALAVLIGPRTFSSGMMLAVDLMDRTDAVFAGEPLAESPTSWGEVKRFPLPNSGLMIGHSTKLFRYGRGKDLRLDADGNLVPDPGLHIVPTYADFQAGRDPVMDAVLALPVGG